MSEKILVVEDDPSILRGLQLNLTMEGYLVRSAMDGETGLQLARSERPDLLVVDVMLPRLGGLELVREVRAGDPDVPIVILSAKGHESDKVTGLSLGADDYIVKPFSLGELSARIETVLRRSATVVDRTVETATRRYGDLTINETTHEATRHGQLVDLTAKEFALLAFLAAHPRQVFSREQLLRQVWESSAEWQTDATVTEHIRRLRGKIEDDPDHPGWIVTVRGAGYRFEPGSSRRPPAH